MANADCPICGGDPRWEVAGYCSHVHVKGGPNPSLSKIRPARTQEAQEELEAIDARLRAAEERGRASVAARAGTPPETPAPQKPKRKRRRTKEEMAEVRAEAADRIRRVRRRVTPAWLADQDEVESDFLAAVTRHEEKD